MRRLSAALAVSAALASPASPAMAEPAIGSAATIEKDVRGEIAERAAAKLAVGDEIFAQEVLLTGTESRGKFVFQDRTDLQLGPSSRVKLDNFVYSGENGVTFNAAKGVFRFVSAPAGHKDYVVRTPNATIGVRGTAFGVRVVFGRTDVVLYDGAVEVCSILGGLCRTLASACTFVTVTGDFVTPPQPLGREDWSFDDSCGGAGQRAARTYRAGPVFYPGAGGLASGGGGGVGHPLVSPN
ncbi:FecR family protein [Methylosinus sp. sav-2]|jgi:ferric-dicitrate binding protein FerR (iron transport regulator)|uniref:FecR family protein n=1 Tax=unclassified Methylosinus TaxID=2624500 RepID=UPI0004652405|nr:MULTISPECIES: FecR family protein [unclassified Methylosinus]TDX63524.1 FecR family protein [Methylosinus sp. sav-2]